MKIEIMLLVILGGLTFTNDLNAQRGFVQVRKGHFYIDQKQYSYVGANYWYGGLAANTEAGKIRVKNELDFLSKNGISNLRVLAGGEGTGTIIDMKRVSPPLQISAGVFDSNTLKGLDFLLVEMGKRKMKAVIYLSNNWEWSGGFFQYLNWAGKVSDSLLKSKWNWEVICDNVSKFYSCDNCISLYHQQVQLIIGRKNSINGIKYCDDPTIMTWQLANEPRPMRAYAITDFKKWVSNSAAMIKSLDHHHLVTTGSEGEMGSENMEVFKEIHTDQNIDYATIHIWPKNWGWFKDTSISASWPNIIERTEDYITRHVNVLTRINKPLVIEEFGLPRDLNNFTIYSSTELRDRYYTVIANAFVKNKKQNGILGGINFWAFSGSGRPAHLFWQEGDDLLGDPVQEEQGLNSVFDSDSSTWKILSACSKNILH